MSWGDGYLSEEYLIDRQEHEAHAEGNQEPPEPDTFGLELELWRLPGGVHGAHDPLSNAPEDWRYARQYADHRMVIRDYAGSGSHITGAMRVMRGHSATLYRVGLRGRPYAPWPCWVMFEVTLDIDNTTLGAMGTPMAVFAGECDTPTGVARFPEPEGWKSPTWPHREMPPAVWQLNARWRQV